MSELTDIHTQPHPEPPRRWITVGFFLVTVGSLASYYLWLYSSCLDLFFFLDDFWTLREAESITIRSPLDLWQFFRPVPFFLLYRPITSLGYFYAMRQLFDHDPTAYHATQLAFNILNAVLVCGIATLLFRSRALGIATAFAYASAPGHAVAAYWNASFVMTGTALFYFLGLWIWLRTSSRWRTPVTAALFVTALLAGEHAITFPVSLTLVAWLGQREDDWRRLVCEQGVLYGIALAYGCVKLTYMWLLFAGFFTGENATKALFAAQTSYAVHFDPLLILHNVGYCLGFALSSLYARGLSHAWAVAFGTIVITLAVTASLFVTMNRGASLPVRVATLGIDLFVVALGPVFLLRGHLEHYYIGIAAFGTALAIVGFARAVPRVSPVAVTTAVTALVLANALSGPLLARRQRDLWMFVNHSEYAKAWIYAVTQRVGRDHVEEVIVPRNVFTEYLFEQGQAHRTLACARYRVRLSENIAAEEARAGSAVVPRAQRVPEPTTRSERWSWMHAACARERERPTR